MLVTGGSSLFDLHGAHTLEYAHSLPADVFATMLPQKLLSLVVFAVLKWIIDRGHAAPKHAGWAGLVLLTNATFSVVCTAWLAPETDPGAFLQVLVVAAGLFLLSRRDAAIHLVLIWVAWLIVENLSPGPPRASQALVLAIFTVVSWVSLIMRIRILSQLYDLRVHDAEKSDRLSEALKIAETSRMMLDQRVEERTAELRAANEELRCSSRERESLQEQLLHSQKVDSLGRLAGGIAHDFNNLLTVMMAHIDLARMSTEDPELLEHLNSTRAAAEGGANLTTRLLAFSRKQVLHKEKLDLVTVVDELRRLVLPLLGEDIEVSTSALVACAPVLADAGQLQQVLLNLCVNARDAMPDGGHLSIQVLSPEPGWLAITVSDTGCGIDPKNIALVLEPFFTTKPPSRGTGLGLASVDGIVSQLGGRLELQSELGKGTDVTVFLPLYSGVEIAPSKPRGGEAPGSQGELVLLVEDEDQLRKLACKSLQRLGYEVLSAGNGAEAIALLAATGRKPVILVTDVVMPVMDGGKLARHLKAELPELKVLFMSGYTDDRLEGLPLLEPDYGFLPKPYSMEQLGLEIRRVLGSSKTLQNVI